MGHLGRMPNMHKGRFKGHLGRMPSMHKGRLMGRLGNRPNVDRGRLMGHLETPALEVCMWMESFLWVEAWQAW